MRIALQLTTIIAVVLLVTGCNGEKTSDEMPEHTPLPDRTPEQIQADRDALMEYRKAFAKLETSEEQEAALMEFLESHPDASTTPTAVDALTYRLTRSEDGQQEALRIVNKAIPLVTNERARLDIQRRKAQILGALEKSDELKSLAEEMIASGHLEHLDWLLLSRAANSAGLSEIALKTARRATSLAREGKTLTDMDDPDFWTATRIERTKAMQIASPLVEEAVALAEMGNTEEALSTFEEADSLGHESYLGIPKSNVDIKHAELLIETGSYDEAIGIIAPRAIYEQSEESLELLQAAFEGKNTDGTFEDFLETKRDEIAKPVDDFTFYDYDGNPVKISDYRGKIVFLNFWFPNCYYCLQELPTVMPFVEKYAGQGYDMIVIDSKRNIEGGLEVIEEKNFIGEKFYLNGADENEFVYELFGIQGFPTTYLLDREGRIKYLHYGYRPGDEVKIEEHIQELLKE